MKNHEDRLSAPDPAGQGASSLLSIDALVDEDTRLSYEIAARIQQLRATSPSLLVEETYQYITFTPEDEPRGLTAIFFAGFVASSPEDRYLVSQSTRSILDALAIPYLVTPEYDQADSSSHAHQLRRQ